MMYCIKFVCNIIDFHQINFANVKLLLFPIIMYWITIVLWWHVVNIQENKEKIQGMKKVKKYLERKG